MAKDKRPNILLIITDHQVWYGHFVGPDGLAGGIAPLRLPVWERFCREGTSFARAYSVCPICTPARSSLMTGVFPSRHNLRWNTDGGPRWGSLADFRQGELLYSHHLSRAGYRNAYVGKWHCGHERLPVDYGVEGWSLRDYGKVYMSEAYRAYADRLGCGDARARIEHNLDRPEWEGTTQTLHHPSPWHFMNGSGILAGPPEAHEEPFVAHQTVSSLVELAAGPGASQPWSLVSSFWGPHQPYFPSEAFASRVAASAIGEHPSFRDDLSGRPLRYFLHRDFHHVGARNWRDWPTWQEILARCYAQALQLDAAVGTILDALAASGRADDTLVIWCADHGDAVASHGGLWDKASTLTEEVVRVPLAVRWPGRVRAGAVCRAPVSNMDVTATMTDAAGAGVPTEMDSRSLLGVCADPAADWPDQVVVEHNGHGEDILQRMVVTDRHKYVAALYDGDEMYDLKEDPYETTNLVGSAGHRHVREDLRGRIIEHIESTGDHRAGKLAYALRQAF